MLKVEDHRSTRWCELDNLLKTGYSISTYINGIDVKIADTSLSSSLADLQVSTTYN